MPKKPDWIELNYKDLTYWITCDRRQWILARSKQWDKKREAWIPTDCSYYPKLQFLVEELLEEVPRRMVPRTLDGLVLEIHEAVEWVRTTFRLLSEVPSEAK